MPAIQRAIYVSLPQSQHQLHTNNENKTSYQKISRKPISELISLCSARLHLALGTRGGKTANQCTTASELFICLHGDADIEGYIRNNGVSFVSDLSFCLCFNVIFKAQKLFIWYNSKNVIDYVAIFNFNFHHENNNHNSEIKHNQSLKMKVKSKMHFLKMDLQTNN